MLESYKGSRKKHKTNYIKIESQNSNNKLNYEVKNVISGKRIDKSPFNPLKPFKQSEPFKPLNPFNPL